MEEHPNLAKGGMERVHKIMGQKGFPEGCLSARTGRMSRDYLSEE